MLTRRTQHTRKRWMGWGIAAAALTAVAAGAVLWGGCSANGVGEALWEKRRSNNLEKHAPDTPTGVSATATSSSSITVSWNGVSGAVGYYVYRSISSSGAYTQAGSISSASYTSTGLSAGTTYYYKVSAYNGTGESSLSSYVSATTLSTGGGGGGFATSLLNPATGQNYKTTVIGGKTWMAENLNYATSSGSWCYENSADSCKKYGRLYDWSAAMNISSFNNINTWGGSDVKHQGVCPAGWHLPSRAEWNQLESDVGSYAGRKLKSVDGWNYYSDSYYGTDEFGFSALPGGSRNDSGGSFLNAGNYGRWWTATEDDSGYAYDRNMYYDDDYLYEYYDSKEDGFAVRCVGD